jgi:uncharacterized protein YndB with AHSA1/START domain
MSLPMTADVEFSGETDVIVRRGFDAPPKLVFEAFTVPALMQRWLLGYPGWTMPVCEVDLRPGGKYRQRWRNSADGTEFGFAGTFHEVEPPSRIMQIERYEEDDSWGDNHITTAFEAVGDKTLVTMTMRFESPEARKAATDTGMTDGMEVSFKLLDGLLAADA